MKFDKNNQAEDMMENKAKQEAQKAAGKAARKAGEKVTKAVGENAAKNLSNGAIEKLAAQVAEKATELAAEGLSSLIAFIVGTVGLPVCLTILVVIIVMCMLPSGIFSTTMGTDATYTSDDLTTETASSASLWETSAESAINSRYSQLVTQNFWNDLTSFFSTGSWGTDGSTFKTEYATASDTGDDGEETSVQYFSSSNRIIAILNEMFKSSIEDISEDGIFVFRNEILIQAESEAKLEMKALAVTAKDIAEDQVSPLETTSIDDYNRVEEETLAEVITLDPEKEEIEDVQYISESAYLLAASSTQAAVADAEFGNTNDADYEDYIKDLLDISFYLSRADDYYKGTKILTTNESCWEPTWTTYTETTTTTVKSTYTEGNGIYTKIYDGVDDGGNPILAGEVEGQRTVTTISTTITYTIKGSYSVQLRSDFEELVNEYFQLEDEGELDETFQTSMIDQVEESSVQLLKFYYEQMNTSVLGLPIEAGSYYINDPFNCTCSVHNGVHNGQDLTAPAGTGLFAIADGTVTDVVNTYTSSTYPDGPSTYGNYVVITHEDGSTAKYCHMKDVYVSVGDELSMGDNIGTVGNTGYSTGAHLHFEITVNGTRVDPMTQGNLQTLLEENEGG